MAIYNEEIDQNDIIKSTEELYKENIIKEIKEIINEFGSFTVSEISADHSPIIEAKGRLSHLVEEFNENDCIVYIYDPSTYNSDELDSYNENYDELEITQLEYILELSNRWIEYLKN